MNAPTPSKPLGYLLFLCVASTLAGFLFGFDASVINGTVLALAAAFGTSAGATGFAVAVVLLGSAVGAFVAGQCSDHFGRKRVMMVTAVLFGVSAWGAGGAATATAFILFRLIGGLGVGAACVVAPAYIAEISPAALRGRLAKLSQESRLGHLSPALFKTQAVEVILALKKLGEQLTAEEAHVLDSASSEVRGQFEADDRAIAEDKIVSMAGSAAGGRR
jgi:fucose permease